ncbi:MAG: HU family DNA-binding protein [Tabrizicola sp.]
MTAANASKSDLIKAVARELDTSDTAAGRVVDAVLNSVIEWATGRKLILRGFGTFEVRHKPARTARNLRTGLPIEVPARDVLTFKAAKSNLQPLLKGSLK